MMLSNKSILSNAQSLTGQARIESLNSIYNRVTLLKSKHISRKLIKAVGNDQYNHHNGNIIQRTNYDINNNSNTHNLPQTISFPFTMRRESFKQLMIDNESDNVETNFWPNQNLLKPSRIIQSINQSKEQSLIDGVIDEGGSVSLKDKGRRRLLSTNLFRGDRSGLSNIMQNQREQRKQTTNNNNRRYLLTDYTKKRLNNNDPNLTILKQHSNEQKDQQKQTPYPNSYNHNPKPSSSSLSHTTTKRPLTSNTWGKQLRSASYRISQSSKSKSKHSLANRTFQAITNNSSKQQSKSITKLINGNNRNTISGNNNNNNPLAKSNNININSNIISNSSKRSTKTLNSSQVSLIKGQSRYQLYKQQISKFEQLYQCLSQVLGSIKQGLNQVQRAVSLYSHFIQSNKLSFIDDFIQARQIRLQKLVKFTRLQQSLSICYLFLEISQQRIYDNESYLVNFIGHSLSNLLLVLRLYVINQRKTQFQQSQFQIAVSQLQKSTYAQQLKSQTDVLLRIQHNTEILTMIHKKLGRNNEKFESCIVKFLKVAEREKYSCSLSAHYIFEFLAMHIHQLNLVGVSPTLEMAPRPYSAPPKKQYTLVIQPLGILQKNGIYRPYMNQFMKWACKNFDVILWTWQQTLQVQALFNNLSQFVTTKLYRHHCKIQDNIFIKDLSRLGRDMNKTVIIDYDKRIFTGYESNGIECRWRGNKSDKSLLVLSQILQQMIASQTSVQDTIIFYAQEIFSVRGY